MLVMSREAGESFVVTVPPGSQPLRIKVMLVEIRGDKARIGFEADRDIVIDREEIDARKAEVKS